MSVIGPYETVEDLPSRPGVSVSTARLSSDAGPAEVVLKVPQSIVGFDSPEVAEGRRRGLLAAAAVQERVASDGKTRRWAGVREVSGAASETFVAFEKFDRSAADLAKQRPLTLGELRSVALAILEGLQELESTCGRGHGRLHGGNVLLRRKGGSPVGEVVLSDPAPEAPESLETDLIDLGHLLREIATGHTDRASDAPKSAWGRLGVGAKFWQGLASDLTSPEAPGSFSDLATLRALVRSKAPTGQGSKAPILVTLVAALMVLGGAGGWFFFLRGDPLISTEEAAEYWAELCVEIEGWCAVSGDVSTQLPALLARELHRRSLADQALVDHVQAHIDEIGALHTAIIEASPRDQSNVEVVRFLSATHRDRMLGAVSPEDWPWIEYCGSADQVKKDITEVHKALVAFREMLSGTQNVLAVRGSLLAGQSAQPPRWPESVGLLSAALEDMEPAAYKNAETDEYDNGVPSKLATALIDAAILDYHINVLNEQWDAFERSIELVRQNANGDPVLLLVGSLSPSLPQDRAWQLQDVSTAAAQIVEAGRHVASVREFVEGNEWPLVERELLRSSFSSDRATRGVVNGDDLAMWISEARDHVAVQEADPLDSIVTGLSSERTKLDRLVGGLASATDPEIRSLADAIDELTAQADGNHRLAWIERNREAIGLAAEGYAEALNDIRERVGAFETTPTELRSTLVALDPFPDSPDPIENTWEKHLAAWIRLLDEAGDSAGGVSTYRIARSSEQLQQSLTELMRQFPRLDPPVVGTRLSSAGLGEAFDEEHDRVLQRAIDSVLNERALGDFGLRADDLGVLATVESARREWHEAVRSVVSDLDAIEVRLRGFVQLTQADGDAESAQATLTRIRASTGPYADLGGDATFDGFASLVTELEAVERADRDTLRGRLSDTSSTPQARFAAWNRLGSGWPNTGTEVDELVAFVQSCRALFGGAEAAGNLEQRVRDEAVRRWSASVGEMIADQRWSDMKTAFAAVDALGVSIAAEQEVVRFNYSLAQLEAAADSESDEASRSTLAALLPAIQSLGLAGAGTVAQQLGDELTRSEGGIAVERLTGSGPGQLRGWRGEVTDLDSSNPGARLRFDGPPGTDISLSFILVDESGGKLVYLCSSEVSISVAREALGIAGTAELNDQRRGIRLWQLGGSGLDATATDQDLFDWHATASGQSKFAPDVTLLQAGPRNRLPMQHISFAGAQALAQAIGCRLPTESEWRRALQLAGGAVGSNVRGSAFDAQSEFVRSQRSAGVVLPELDDGTFASVWDAQAQPGTIDALFQNDTPLFFEEVGGRTGFDHLIGNVAEWVVDDEGEQAAIGWSALAPPVPRSQMTTPIRPRATGRFRGVGNPMSDVGFRLALEIEGSRKPSLARLVREWFAQSTRYVTADG